jgi:hypothetical protein
MDAARPEVRPNLAIPSTPGKVGHLEPMIGTTLAALGLHGKDLIETLFVC